MKTRQTIFLLTLFISSAFLFSACKKEPGVGGDASVRGKVYRKHYNSTFTTLISESYYPDTYVYIIYGDDVSYGQRIRTNYNGEFEFKYLYKGDYQVYTYSIDSAAIVNGILAPADSAVVSKFTITKRKEQITLPEMKVFN